jgi:Protein of unknown function (DUF4232)
MRYSTRLLVGLGALVMVGATSTAAEASDFWLPRSGAAEAQVSASATPMCTTPGLAVWLYTPPGNAAAGRFHLDVGFTNLSGKACSLFGYPGVSALSQTNQQLGTPATHSTMAEHSVLLANGGSATAQLQVVDVGFVATSSCRPMTSASLRIFPPGNTVAAVVAFRLPVCSRPWADMAVDPVQEASKTLI